jgi:prevent-host-death family protein
MRTAPVTDVKNRLSHYLRLVARGETVTILDRGRPVAQLTQVSGDSSALDALVADGLARAPIAKLPRDFFTRKLPRSRSSVQQALREDRDDRF